MEKAQKTALLQHRMTPEWVARLDAWRRSQAVEQGKDISRSEAIRQLVEKAMA